MSIGRTLKWILTISILVRAVSFGWEFVHPLAFDSTFQNYFDFNGYYLAQLSVLAHGYVPYRDFSYSYPPLFIYTLYPFYLLGARIAAVPIVLADAMSAPLIYLIVKKNAAGRVAVAASLTYVLSPFFLLYEGVSWLSEQPMLFFALLSIYLLLLRRPSYSAVVFAIAVLFKQDALFLLPAYLFWMFRREGFRRGVRSAALGATVLFLVSLPFLILAPALYLEYISFAKIALSNATTTLVQLPGVGSGVPSFGGLTFTTTNATLPSLTCSNIVDNVFELSRFCTGVAANGLTLTNWVLIPASEAVKTLLTLVAFALLIPAIPELLLIQKRFRLQLSFAISAAACLIPLIIFSDLAAYKYYFVPLYALLLASSSDVVSLGIAAAFPILSLVSGYPYLTTIAPLIEIQFLLLYWRLRGSTPVGPVIESADASLKTEKGSGSPGNT